MASISVSTTSIASSGTTSSASGGASSSASTIEALKKKLISLQNDLREAASEQTKAGMQKAKLIQMQIQVTQAQLQQLIQQQAQEAAKKNSSSANDALSVTAPKRDKSYDPVRGNNVDVVV